MKKRDILPHLTRRPGDRSKLPQRPETDLETYNLEIWPLVLVFNRFLEK